MKNKTFIKNMLGFGLYGAAGGLGYIVGIWIGNVLENVALNAIDKIGERRANKKLKKNNTEKES